MVKLNEFESYVLGFFQADGHYDGRYLVAELSEIDNDIILSFNKKIKKSSIYYRIRDTNFKNNYKTISLHIRDNELIDKLKDFIPEGKKSEIVAAPENIEYSEIDYWRGVIDGDGSLGFKETGIPYIALNTSSEYLYHDFNSFLEKMINFRLKIKRNKRDNTYNILLPLAKGIIITKLLYQNNEISLNRKNEMAKDIINFDIKNYNSHTNKLPFSKKEDNILLNNIQSVSVKLLPNHHPISISNRRRFLKGLQKYGLL